LVEPEFEPDLWVCVCEVDVVWVDAGWPDWLDVVVEVLPGLPPELGALDVEVEFELEVLGDGWVEDELVGDVPEPLGSEGTLGAGRFGVGTVGTVGVGRFGVDKVGVDRFGVVTVRAEARGSAAMPSTTSVTIAPTTSLRPAPVLGPCAKTTRPTFSRTLVSTSPFRLGAADSLSAGPLAWAMLLAGDYPQPSPFEPPSTFVRASVNARPARVKRSALYVRPRS
jgi:hypothetical protein